MNFSVRVQLSDLQQRMTCWHWSLKKARIQVLNGTTQIGMEDSTAEWLRDQGFNVVENSTTQSMIVSEVIQKGAAPYALSWLVETFEMTAGRIRYDFSPDEEIDLILILGSDWANNNPIP